MYALENLHRRAAFNHALFICAGRLRRSTPPGVETGRLGDDGFLMLVHDDAGMRRLASLARLVRERLSRPVVLSTGRDAAALEGGRTEWVAEVGVGVLSAPAQARPAQALTTARAMSRTAWTYGSRMAWFDPAAGQIMELPAGEPG
jgi:GGDEF domain-containing protein